MDSFCDAALALGKVGEELAARLREEPKRLLPAGYTDPRYDNPLSSLLEAMENLTTSITDYHRGLRGRTIDARLFLDSLVACCEAFLKAQPLGPRALESASDFMGYIGYVGLSAAKIRSKETAEMVAYEIERLLVLACERPGIVDEFMNSVCRAAFEIGLNAEADAAAYRAATTKPGDELRDHVARICALTGQAALGAAKSDLYLRGHTSYVADKSHRDFLARVEARPELR